MQPVHRSGDRGDHLTFRQVWPVDHQDGQAKGPRGGDLGDRALAARVLGDDQIGSVLAQHCGIAGHVKGTARHDHLRLGQWQRAGRRVDKAHQVVVLRLGGERLQMLASDGKEHPARRARKCCDYRRDVGDMCPAVVGAGDPGRAFEGEKRRFRSVASGHRIAAHLRREGVRGVYDMGDRFGRKICAEAVDAAEPAHPHRQRLADGCLGAARVGIDGGQARFGDGARQKARLGGAAEKKDACHG